MNLSNSTIKLTTSIVWWFLTLISYFSIRFSKGLDPEIKHTLNTSEIEFTVLFGCLIFGISSWAISRLIDRTRVLQRNFIIQIVLKTLTLFVVLVVLIAGIDIFHSSELNPDVILSFFSTPQMRSVFIFFLFSSILLNVIFMAVDIIGVQNTVKILLGKFKVPLIENRIFLFIDLKDSTSITQEIGHQKYGKLMQEVYSVINDISHKFQGEIYQYIGDEVIISWPSDNEDNYLNATKTYLEIEKEINSLSSYFKEKFNLTPEFWAGAASGEVTVVEIGTFKRHITYFGDALNMASRLTSLCKEANSNFLISSHIYSNIQNADDVSFTDLGEYKLRGFSKSVNVYSPRN